MQPKLHVIMCSTRPARVGLAAGKWVAGFADGRGDFDVTFLDLMDFDLPMYDEPHHPRSKRYAHDYSKAWSDMVDAADAYVFVTPEYNFNPSPALLNAMTYLFHEWQHKACGFVSYGGEAGAWRGVQTAKLMAMSLNMMPMVESVVIAPVFDMIDADGRLQPNDAIRKSAAVMLDELRRWAVALRGMRQAE